ncbi:nuclear transcription factor Y subunit beta isoform X1 [Erinaceus europaeus]|uniref:Nuclear transcription factor Y subunit beta isoform X1 n=1 Tax=Erinaceus europaeus TaxID=9365 RepID=A0ABM3XN97_ERIEU|nr:nuclear transcription factor Y subunit beta isoform X1 [Erinaceus europaeus]
MKCPSPPGAVPAANAAAAGGHSARSRPPGRPGSRSAPRRLRGRPAAGRAGPGRARGPWRGSLCSGPGAAGRGPDSEAAEGAPGAVAAPLCEAPGAGGSILCRELRRAWGDAPRPPDRICLRSRPPRGGPRGAPPFRPRGAAGPRPLCVAARALGRAGGMRGARAGLTGRRGRGHLAGEEGAAPAAPQPGLGGSNAATGRLAAPLSPRRWEGGSGGWTPRFLIFGGGGGGGKLCPGLREPERLRTKNLRSTHKSQSRLKCCNKIIPARLKLDWHQTPF